MGHVEKLRAIPNESLPFVQAWLEQGACPRMVSTLKFQGDTDFEVVRAFARITGSRLFRLSPNEHEVTWVFSLTSGT